MVKIIYTKGTGALMTDAQLRAALSAMDEGAPARRAITQLIEMAFVEAVADAADRNLDATKGTHPGGRVDALAELRAQLEGLWGRVEDSEDSES